MKNFQFGLLALLTLLCAASSAHARRFDPETGLIYNRARMYSPEHGRFVNRDPIGYEGGIDLYEYVRSQPTRYLDPFGHNRMQCPVICNGEEVGTLDFLLVAGIRNLKSGDNAYGWMLGGFKPGKEGGTCESCKCDCDKYVWKQDVTQSSLRPKTIGPDNPLAGVGTFTNPKPGDYPGESVSKPSKPFAWFAQKPGYPFGDTRFCLFYEDFSNQNIPTEAGSWSEKYKLCLYCKKGGKETQLACVTWGYSFERTLNVDIKIGGHVFKGGQPSAEPIDIECVK
jgi:RHS repeat-associated protein